MRSPLKRKPLPGLHRPAGTMVTQPALHRRPKSLYTPSFVTPVTVQGLPAHLSGEASRVALPTGRGVLCGQT